ncbi:MAG: tetratricopeptide repeat protein [Nitrospiraceae bacterium]|nr:MAG: tetratricopeptide repeat protein [Nitrospiraceae bacterium]
MKDKNSIVSAAQKFAAKGQIDKAISEWEKLLADRVDGNVQNTIGDLHLRKGAEEDAKKAFSKAAELFRKDGFYPKAIAIYKKILNIDPADVDAIIAMAKLNADRGLTGNAVDYYYRAAEIYHKDGATEKATLLAEKMIQLSPTDVSTRSKIAYLYFRLGLRERAAAEYSSIGTFYGESGNDEKSREFYNKAIEYDPENIEALIGLSRLLEKAGDAEQAFRELDKARTIAPENRDLLLHYAHAAVAHNKLEDAKEALLKAGGADASDIRIKRILGDIYIREGERGTAWEHLQPCIEKAIKEEGWTEARDLLEPFRELHPLRVSQYILSILQGQEDEEGAYQEVLALAELHEREGRHDDALHCYREALAARPDDIMPAEKVRELEHTLGIAPHEHEAAGTHEETAAADELTAAIPDHNVIHFPETEEDARMHHEPPPAGEQEIPAEGIPLEECIPDDSTAETGEFPGASLTEELSADDIAARKAEAEFYVQQGLVNEAVDLYEAICAACPGDEEIAGRLAELKPRIDGAEGAPSGHEAEAPSQSPDIDSDLKALFAEFGGPEEEKAVDYEAHYVAGLEYKEKGRLDEAVKELKIAAQDPEKKVRNRTMLAMCYKEQGAYPLAAEEFDRVLHRMTPDDSTYLHVKYELANARMANGEKIRAHELFAEIHKVDPDFKDVSERLYSLKGAAAQSREGSQDTKRDRVSYI